MSVQRPTFRATGKRIVVYLFKDHGRTASINMTNMVRAMYDALKAIERAAAREVFYDTPTPEPQPAGDEPADETATHTKGRGVVIWPKPRRLLATPAVGAVTSSRGCLVGR